MQIHTTARHCELDPEVRIFAQQRLEKLGRFARDIQEVHLVVTAERYRHHAEITVRVPGRQVVSREESTEARTAIEIAADRLEQRMRRLKERRADRHRHAPPPDGAAAAAEPAELGALLEFDDEEA